MFNCALIVCWLCPGGSSKSRVVCMQVCANYTRGVRELYMMYACSCVRVVLTCVHDYCVWLRVRAVPEYYVVYAVYVRGLFVWLCVSCACMCALIVRAIARWSYVLYVFVVHWLRIHCAFNVRSFAHALPVQLCADRACDMYISCAYCTRVVRSFVCDLCMHCTLVVCWW